MLLYLNDSFTTTPWQQPGICTSWVAGCLKKCNLHFFFDSYLMASHGWLLGPKILFVLRMEYRFSVDTIFLQNLQDICLIHIFKQFCYEIT